MFKTVAKMTLFIYCSILSGCASMLSSSNQDLTVKPIGTTLEVYSWDGKLMATNKNPSDTTVNVHKPIRGQSYLVIAKAANKCPQYWLTSAKESPASWGSSALILAAFIPGIIASIVDSHTGAGWLVEPDKYELNIGDGGTCLN